MSKDYVNTRYRTLEECKAYIIEQQKALSKLSHINREKDKEIRELQKEINRIKIELKRQKEPKE